MAPLPANRPLRRRHFLSPDEWQAMKSARPVAYEDDCPVFGINVDLATANELLKADHRYHVTGVGYLAFTTDQVPQRLTATVYPDE